ncbi:polysaccharide pyruvyl transferase CsaB [Paenibacillus sp. MER TA 81-3]|uniref:polysaccharide pyruvyl transferase CsaB n=1 Tax=Paenibacillus sp. MER TA 81-3 TaxID=2939573 RepID=UPI00203C18AA|nr:polysaccharide pyruvyl transferase CsaB [Paenibacillus sp. MER TA 81-3]MCM3338712.1 polysaccharide pyruvyl transferase CsaB [Paenibacillus sp. MER TA 81-3]
MASEVTRIALSGYYGFNNSGDEAVLLSILTALERAGEQAGMKLEPVVLSGDPATTTRLYGVRAVHRMKPGDLLGAIRSCDGLISGGGSLLQDATSSKTIPYYLAVLKLAQWFRKPTFIYAQGVGPVRRESFYPYIRHVFNRSAYISVRDNESADLLTRMGLQRDRMHVVPDPVMGLRLPEAESGDASAHAMLPVGAAQGFDEAGRPYVGVSLRFWNEDRTDMTAIADMLKRVCRAQTVHLRFLPFHGQADEEASRFVMESLKDEVKLWNGDMSGACDENTVEGDMGDEVPYGASAVTGSSVMSLCPALEHPQAMLREVSQCRVLVGMRLHSLIYAASQEIPMLGISYDPKIDQFLHRLNLTAVGSTARLDASEAADAILHSLENVEAWQTAHHQVISALKQEAEQPAQQVAAWLRHKK